MKPLRVLVGCEYSGTVRDAFIAQGHDAMSCDLLPTDVPGPHYCGDVRDVLNDGWDLMIAHPPCDYLTVSGNRWFSDEAKAGPGILTGAARRMAQSEAVEFVKMLWDAPISCIAIENPIGRLSTLWMKPTQIIQPWQFGHGETKATCLWLKNLPKLEPTEIVEGREQRIFKMPPSADRWKLRSATYAGIAQAMADQWSDSRMNVDGLGRRTLDADSK